MQKGVWCYWALFDLTILIHNLKKIFSLTCHTHCYSENSEIRNPSCPVCQPCLNQLAESLPFAHCSQSRLYCHISGLPLNENNLPMMLPNGYIYGEQVSGKIKQNESSRSRNLKFLYGSLT